MGQAAEERMTTDIDRTRESLSRDVDALYDKVSPGRVLDRRKTAVRGRLSSMRDSVMGSAHQVTDSAQGAASGAAGMMQDGAESAVHAVHRRTEGSPLGAGLVAFGAGMVVAALIPSSEKEAQVAHRVTEAAKESPLTDQAKSVGQELAQDLKESATQAAHEVGSTAQEAVQHVADESRSAVQEVRDEAPGTSGGAGG